MNKDELKILLADKCERFNTMRQEPGEGDPDCKKCNNNRRIAYVHEDKFNIAECFIICECTDIIRTKQLAKSSGLGEKLRENTFDNFLTSNPFQKEMKTKAQEFVKNGGGNWFVTLGQSGAGKTHICTAICGEFLKQGKSVSYVRWAVELKRIKMLGGGSVEYDIELDKLLRHQVIYIDDLFKRGTGQSRQMPISN